METFRERFAGPPPVAVKGILDLRDITLEHHNPVTLAGEWELYWGKWVDGQTDGLGRNILPDYYVSPEFWDSNPHNFLPTHGFGTYRLRVLLPQSFPYQHDHLEILTGLAISSARMRIYNAEGIPLSMEFNSGKISDNAINSEPKVVQQVLTVNPAPEIQIFWQISNYAHHQGGPYKLPILGTSSSMHQLIFTKFVLNSLVLGILLIMGLYHLCLFGLNNYDRGALWMGLTCLLTMIWSITGYHILELYFSDFDHFEFYPKIRVSSGMLVIFCLLRYIRTLFVKTETVLISLARFLEVSFLLLVCATWLMSMNSIHFRVLPQIFYVLVGLSLLWMLGTLIYVWLHHREKTAGILLWGFLIFFAAALHDISIDLHQLNRPFISQNGFVVFIFFQGLVLAINNRRIHRKAIKLADELVHRNEELVVLTEDYQLLNTELEERISLRTRDLSDKNNEMLHNLKLAGEVQGSIIQPVVNAEFVEHFLWFKPLEQISGDIYYSHHARNGDFFFFLGDASGHGISAAFLTILVEMLLEQMDEDFSLTMIANHINNNLFSHTPMDHFMSAILFRISPSGECSYINAGHPELILIRSDDQQMIKLEATCLLMGVIADIPIHENKLQLSHGDRLLLFTDGLTDSVTADGNRFRKHFMEVLQNSNDLELKHFFQNIKDSFMAYTQGTSPADDITLAMFEYGSNFRYPHT
ncbi:MAG: SpoIIE family protein phosphatase [SAR324 cluster bacterium]|nr:SpoIIE family protein phosphatase [SAR324 cluster bacterium]